jgi:hypothetical protein
MKVGIPFSTFHLSAKQQAFLQEYTTQQDCKHHITHHTTRHLLPSTATSSLQSCRKLCDFCELSSLSTVSPTIRPRPTIPPTMRNIQKMTLRRDTLITQTYRATSTAHLNSWRCVKPALVFFPVSFFFLPTNSSSSVCAWAEKELVECMFCHPIPLQFYACSACVYTFLQHNKTALNCLAQVT